MEDPNWKQVFTEAFDTFKAFDTLTVADAGVHPFPFPATIWQILNHLIQWQAYQLQLLEGIESIQNIREADTWIREQAPHSAEALEKAATQFKQQIADLQDAIIRWNGTEQIDTAKLKQIQEVSLHLSFHLGEVVLIRRVTGSYPLPHQMKAFLHG
jgi:hypothetical protein